MLSDSWAAAHGGEEGAGAAGCVSLLHLPPLPFPAPHPDPSTEPRSSAGPVQSRVLCLHRAELWLCAEQGGQKGESSWPKCS